MSAAGGFALVLVVTRTLGAADSGRFFLAVAVFTVLIAVGKLGTDTSLVRFVSVLLARGRDDQVVPLAVRAAVVVLVVSGLVGVVIFVLSRPLAALLVADPSGDDQVLLRWVAVGLPLGAVTLTLLGATRGAGSVATFVWVEQVFKPLARPAAVVVVCALGAGVVGAFVAWLVPAVLGLAVVFVSMRARLRGARAGEAPSGPPVGGAEFWRFALPRALSGTLEVFSLWIGVMMLSALTGSADAGVFTAVARVVTAGLMVMVAMRLALGPHLGAAFEHRQLDRVEALHAHSTTWAVLVSFPFFLLVAVFADVVLEVFGAGFEAGAAALTVLAAANLVNVAVGNVQSIVLMCGRSSWTLVGTTSALAVQVLLGLALIPSYGLVGAAWAFGAGVVVNNLVAWWQVSHGLRLRVWSRPVVAALLLTTAVFGGGGLAARAWIGSGLLAAVLVASVGTVAIVAVALARPRLLDLPAGYRVLARRFDPTGATT
ncbi:oligosaccharide flippase family protein [Nocardioides sp. AX2bis]|uniref:oligosaccharide flippase family protein n=1 Tax=Nocardioides sp. AX2bis TaxID=2653157 RepID=UPI0022A79BC1|nr:oligosaccharide flippase family protein [Nocardioides sp. AX2bis]